MDRLSKTCLLLIVIFLAVIMLRPIVMPQPALAEGTATNRYEYSWKSLTNYTITNSDPDEGLTALLKTTSDQGWDLAGFSGTSNGFLFIFRKPLAGASVKK